MSPKPLSEYGWKVQDDHLTIEWDTDDNMDAIRKRVATLLKGCGCKTGCQTPQCGCKAKGQACGEGCNCTNTDMNTTANSLEETSIEEIVEDSPPEDLDEVME